MHTKPMSDDEGTFQDPLPDVGRACPKCGGAMVCEPWESSCGGFTDYRYTCLSTTCKHVLWIDGIDS